MIHSLSGGVIKSATKHTFIKVAFAGEENPRWLLCDEFPVEVGDTAVIDGKIGLIKGEVLRVDKNVFGDAAPVPMNRARQVIQIVNKFSEDK